MNSSAPFTSRPPRSSRIAHPAHRLRGMARHRGGPRVNPRHHRGITATTLCALLAVAETSIYRDFAQSPGSESSSPVSPIRRWPAPRRPQAFSTRRGHPRLRSGRCSSRRAGTPVADDRASTSPVRDLACNPQRDPWIPSRPRVRRGAILRLTVGPEYRFRGHGRHPSDPSEEPLRRALSGGAAGPVAQGTAADPPTGSGPTALLPTFLRRAPCERARERSQHVRGASARRPPASRATPGISSPPAAS